MSSLPFRDFGFIFPRTFRRSVLTYSWNSVLSSETSLPAKFYSSVSLLTGLIMVQQSRSVKKVFKSRRILFFCSTLSLKPFYSRSARSRYSFEVIAASFSSESFRAKSLTTHINEGKIFEYSSGSTSPGVRQPDALSYICFVRLTTRLSWFNEVSSIEPILLYKK